MYATTTETKIKPFGKYNMLLDLGLYVAGLYRQETQVLYGRPKGGEPINHNMHGVCSVNLLYTPRPYQEPIREMSKPL